MGATGMHGMGLLLSLHRRSLGAGTRVPPDAMRLLGFVLLCTNLVDYRVSEIILLAARFVTGPGVAAKVVVVARTSVSDAPLGEPFRVLTRESAEKVSVALGGMFCPRLLGALSPRPAYRVEPGFRPSSRLGPWSTFD